MSAETRDLVQAARLSAAATRHWQPALTGRQYLEALREHGLDEGALRLLPHLLGRRESIWWGCLCVWELAREAEESTHAALTAVCRWITDPSPDHQQATRPLAEVDNLTTPAGCLAMAVWQGASVAELTGRLVAAAVLLAGVQREPERCVERYARFLDMGRQVALGRHRWSSPTEKTPVVTGQPEFQPAHVG